MIRIEANEIEHSLLDVLQLSQVVLHKPGAQIAIKYRLMTGDVLSILLELGADGKQRQEILVC